jgi:hypothetical protein
MVGTLVHVPGSLAGEVVVDIIVASVYIVAHDYLEPHRHP